MFDENSKNTFLSDVEKLFKTWKNFFQTWKNFFQMRKNFFQMWKNLKDVLALNLYTKN